MDCGGVPVHAFRAKDLPAATFFARGQDQARLAHLLVERDGAGDHGDDGLQDAGWMPRLSGVLVLRPLRRTQHDEVAIGDPSINGRDLVRAELPCDNTNRGRIASLVVHMVDGA